MTHPPNVMPEELQRAHYIMQIVELEKLNAELLDSVNAFLMAARDARLPMDLTVTIAQKRAAKAEVTA